MQKDRFATHRWWIVTVLVTTPLIAMAAGGQLVTFTAGKIISSSEVNANFAALAARLDTLEASAQKRTIATPVMANIAGPLPQSRTFTSSGGDLLLIISGSAYSRADKQSLLLFVQVDGKQVGVQAVYVDLCCAHNAFPTQAIPLTGVAAGSHSIALASAPDPTLTNDLDYFSVTVVETFH